MDPFTIGALLMAGGTVSSMYGTSQKDKAQKRALKDYQNAMNEHVGQEQAAMNEENGILSGFAQERQHGIGQYINELSNSSRGIDPRAFQQSQKGALTDIGKLTGGQQSQYMYSGAPRSQAEDQQAGITGQANNRMAEAMLADHAARQIQERQQMSQHRMAFGDLMRQGRGKTMKERMDLAKALRDLDWQKKTQAMQGQLDDAGRKGQWATTLGGLGQQAGSMAMLYGLSTPGTAGKGFADSATMGTTNASAATAGGLKTGIPYQPIGIT